MAVDVLEHGLMSCGDVVLAGGVQARDEVVEHQPDAPAGERERRDDAVGGRIGNGLDISRLPAYYSRRKPAYLSI